MLPKQFGYLFLTMRTAKLFIVLLLMAAGANSLLGPAQAQSPAAGPVTAADVRASVAAVVTLQQQQKTIADNQAQMDAKLATITENVRVARIYASRVK